VGGRPGVLMVPYDPIVVRGEARESTTHKDAISAWLHELAPFGIVTTDRELRVTSWNHWLATHSEIGPELAIGRPIFELFPSIRTRRLDDYFHRALAGEVSVLSVALHEYLLPLKNSIKEDKTEHMQQTARIAPLHWGTEILGTISIIEDVTQREFQSLTLRRQHAREKIVSWALGELLGADDPLETIKRVFPRVAKDLGVDGYFNYLVAPNGKDLILHASENLTAEQLHEFGRLPIDGALCGHCAETRQPVLMKDLQSSTDPRDAALRKIGVTSYAAFPLLMGERLLGTLCFTCHGRDCISQSDVEFAAVIAQYVSIAIDRAIREKTLAEAKERLHEHATQLESKVEERTARLYETISQLESFSYSIAHDLRAPIRALKGYCEVLTEDHWAELSKGGQSIVAKLARSSQRLDELTRDLLKFSRLSLEAMEWTTVDLDEVIHDIRALNPTLTPDVLTVKGPLGVVLGQRTFVHQCFSNLFDNALKFARAGYPIQIIVRSEPTLAGQEQAVLASSKAPFNPATSTDERANGVFQAGKFLTDGSCLRVWVEDNGVGIPPEAHQKIFGIFERASDQTTEGTGIGLAIVARAMQRMQGACGVDSHVNEGSRFWLVFHTLPRRPVAAPHG